LNKLQEENLVCVKKLKKYFKISSKKYLKAVDNISFCVNHGETFGLIGESGCGKTTLGRSVLRLYDLTSGEIYFKNKNITHVNFLPYRRKMQMIFQDPSASLNPRMTVGEIIQEPLEIHKIFKTQRQKKQRVMYLLNQVGLNSEHANRYSHEFSGGQQQRIGIARALAVEPEFIVCDEPISALDVSIQAQIINMLESMQEKLKLAYLFISHDISIVRYISKRIGVMYLGSLVELASTHELNNPMHPYTKILLSSVPVPDPRKNKSQKKIILTGEIPSPIDQPSGCKFHTRCPYAKNTCKKNIPELREISSGHFVACDLI